MEPAPGGRNSGGQLAWDSTQAPLSARSRQPVTSGPHGALLPLTQDQAIQVGGLQIFSGVTEGRCVHITTMEGN